MPTLCKQVQAIVDHHHADVKTASKVRFAEPGDEAPTDAPSPPLADTEDKDKDDKVNITPARTTIHDYICTGLKENTYFNENIDLNDKINLNEKVNLNETHRKQYDGCFRLVEIFMVFLFSCT